MKTALSNSVKCPFRLCVLMMMVLLIVSPISCTNEEPERDENTGSISFSIVWPESTDDQPQALMSAVDCNAFGISTITCNVYNGTETSGNFLKGETWQCAAHSGTVMSVSPGSSRRVVVTAKDSSGKSIYKGEKPDITVTAGQTVKAGTVDMVSLKRITFAKLPDTGQTESYTNTFGEDSDYTINPPSYTKLDDTGTALGDNAASWDMVKDNVTGLIWQKETASARNWDAAVTYCENLTLGGYSDWRLPTIMELSTLVNAGDYSPAINTDFFPDTQSSYYWSSSTTAYNTDGAWLVPFYYGDVNSSNKSSTRYVRAVRGGQ